MEPREQDILQRYYKRLAETLEPEDLLKSLVTVGAIEDEEVKSVLQTWSFESEQKLETRAEWLLESLRNHTEGMKYLIQGLLLSEIQDFLAREIIEDDYFTEEGKNCVIRHVDSAAFSSNDYSRLRLELFPTQFLNS